MNFKNVIIYCLAIIFSLTIPAEINIACKTYSVLEKALEAAGNNRPQLEKVLQHYRSKRDTAESKYAAAVFLIENMEGHSYVTYMLHDTAGVEVELDVLSFPNYDSLMAIVQQIETDRGELDYKRKGKSEDLQCITSEFLIGNIDYAFKAWRERPWAGWLSFEQFCEYVLPYRGSNEPLENWREFFFDVHNSLENQMTNPTDPMEAAALINDSIMSWFTFDPRYYFHPTDQGLDEMLRQKKGRCEDMTNLTIYAMRANGLAVTSDYTPYWANSGNNHAWNAILTSNGDVVPFMGAEANPGKYRLANKLAKVYRKTCSVQRENLIFQPRKQESVPRWLAGKNYTDVTADYATVSDVAINFSEPVPDSVDIAYLCVFNSGEWKPIDWGRIQQGTALFENIGTDIAYLPALYLNEEVVPFGPPFILTKECDVKMMVGDASTMISLKLASTTSRKLEISTDGIVQSNLTEGKTYQLFYWDEDWQSLGKQAAGMDPLVFDGVPSSALYWLVAEGSDKEERIFTMDDDLQVWW